MLKTSNPGQKGEPETGITSKIAWNLKAIVDSTSVLPRVREEKSAPFKKALEKIYKDNENRLAGRLKV